VTVKTYSDYTLEAASEKIILAHLEPVQRLMVWTQVSGFIYRKSVDYFVVDVREDDTSLTERDSLGGITGSGEWFFDAAAKFVYVRTTGDADPTLVFISAKYRMFFANTPVNESHDFTNTGKTVCYQPLIENISSFGSQLEHDNQIGISLDGSGNISFQNNDGFFEPIFDTLFWENKEVRIVSWNRDLDIEDHRILYEGIIQTKQYSTTKITFTMRDFVTQLRDELALPRLSTADGTFPRELIGKPKRRIYGRRQGHKCFGTDNQLVEVPFPDGTTEEVEGVELTGTFTIDQDGSGVAGTGTLLLTEASPGDKVFFVDIYGEKQEFRIKSIGSDLAFTLPEKSTVGYVGPLFLTTEFKWRDKNRTWVIAGHKIREPEPTITAVTELVRITVDSTDDIFPDDFLTFTVDGTEHVRQVRRITGSTIVLRQGLPGFPSVGSTVKKGGITNVFLEGEQLNQQSDYVIDQTGADAILILDPLAEFNRAIEQEVSNTNVTFTNLSRLVTGNDTNFTEEMQSRDWIRPATHGTWYEILQVVSGNTLLLRTEFTGATFAFTDVLRKNVDVAGNDANVVCDLWGITADGTTSGTLLRTASDVVKDLLTVSGLGPKLNDQSFIDADGRNQFLMSLAYPLVPGDDSPTLREAIDVVNQTAFGALTKNQQFEIQYNVLSVYKDVNNLRILDDDDIVNFKVSSKSQEIVRNTTVNFRHKDFSSLTGESSFSTQSISSALVKNLIDNDRSNTFDIYLYDAEEVKIILQRYAFFNEISQGIVTLNAKLAPADLVIGDIVLFKLDRLYQRFGSGGSKLRAGVISGFKKNGETTQLEIDDLSGWFFTVGTITPNDAQTYSLSSELEQVLNGYMTADDELIDDLDHTYRINLIG
jgi:hypothetical protein